MWGGGVDIPFDVGFLEILISIIVDFSAICIVHARMYSKVVIISLYRTARKLKLTAHPENVCFSSEERVRTPHNV